MSELAWNVLSSVLLFAGGWLLGAVVGTKAVRASVLREVRRVIEIHVRSHQQHPVQGAEHPAAIKSLRDLHVDLQRMENRQLALVQKDEWELRQP